MSRLGTEILVQTLSLHSHSSDPFVVLTATGELDLDTQDAFEAQVKRHVDRSAVVVDLSGLDFFAISALRSLISCHQHALSIGHQLCFAEPSAQTRRLLGVSGLDAVLPVAPTLQHVLRSASPTAGGVGVLPAALGSFLDQSDRDLAQLEVR